MLWSSSSEKVMTQAPLGLRSSQHNVLFPLDVPSVGARSRRTAPESGGAVNTCRKRVSGSKSELVPGHQRHLANQFVALVEYLDYAPVVSQAVLGKISSRLLRHLERSRVVRQIFALFVTNCPAALQCEVVAPHLNTVSMHK